MKYYYEKWSYVTKYQSPSADWRHDYYTGGEYYLDVVGDRSEPIFLSDVGFRYPGIYQSHTERITESKPIAYAITDDCLKAIKYAFCEKVGNQVKVDVLIKTCGVIKSKNKLIETIIGEDGAYPPDGISEAYWYVKKVAYIPPPEPLPPVVKPMISGQDSDLGVINRDHTVSYTATHESGCMVTEQIDSTTIRMYTVSSPSTLAIPESIWIGLKNGSHTLTITAAAQDGTSGVSVRKYTFTKRERLIKFTLLEPIRCKDRVSVLTMRLLGNLGKAQLKVHACNNALETDPAWEDISSNVQSETEYTFINNTGQTGLNIMVEIQGDEGQGIYLSGINLKYKEGKDGIW